LEDKVMKAPFVLGRMLFGGYFLYNAVNHFKEYKNLAQYAKAKHVPMPEAAVLTSGAALAIGGASILLGTKPKLGTLAILGFLAAVTPTMHDFWNAQDPNQKQADMINFSKNMALLGGALALMGVEEPWPASVSRGKSDGASARDEEDERPLRLSERRLQHKKAA
jgi:putative oxidoreductase